MKKLMSLFCFLAVLFTCCQAPKNKEEIQSENLFIKAEGYAVEAFIDAGDTTEGLAFNGKDLYVGLYHDGKILKINANKEKTVFASGFSNLAGMAFDKNGDLWAVEYSGIINQIGPDGVVKAKFTQYKYYYMNKKFSSPNAIAIHSNGTVYVTDGGAIVSIKDGQAAYMTSISFLGGANGMALAKDEKTLYALECINTTFLKAGIYKIKLDDNGKYVSKSKLTPSKAMTYLDGIALDANGLIYVTSDLNTISTVHPETGAVTVLYSSADLHTPANFAFGFAPGFDNQSIYITQLGNLKQLSEREGYTMIKKMFIGAPGMVLPPLAQ